jgi:hypothetical protein
MTRTFTVWPHAAALQDVLRERARRDGCALSVGELTWPSLLEELTAAHPAPRQVDPVACRLLLADVTRAIEANLSPLPTQDPSLVELAAQAFAAAREAMVTPGDFLRAAGLVPPANRERLTALARLYGALESRKEAAGLWDSSDVTRAAVESAETFEGYGPLDVRGVVDWTPARLELLRSFSRRHHVSLQLPDVVRRPSLMAWLDPVLLGLEQTVRGELDVHWEPLAPQGAPMRPLLDALFSSETAPSAPVTTALCPDLRAEAELAADWMATRLEEGVSPSELAVVVRRRDALLDAVLADAFSRRGIPLRLPVPDPAWRALCRGAMRLLRAAEGRVHVEDLEPLAMLWGASTDKARAFSDELAPRVRTLLTPQRQELLRKDATLDGLSSVLASLPDAATVEAHGAALRAALLRCPPLTELADAWARLDEVLETLARSAQRAGSGMLVRSAFMGVLEGAFSGVTGESPDGVAVLTVPDVVGRRLHGLVLLQVVDGIFPEPAARNPLLGEEDRRALNEALGRAAFRTEEGEGPMRAPPRDRLEPLLLVLTLAAARECALVTSSQTAPGGRVVTPGPLFLELRRALGVEAAAAPRAVGSPMEVRRDAGRRVRLGDRVLDPLLWARRGALNARATDGSAWGGQLSDDVAALAALQAGGFESRPTSATNLQVMGECGFRFLAEHLLQLTPYEPSGDVPPPMELGTVAHEVLEDFYGARLNQPFTVPSADEQAWVRKETLRRGAHLTGNPDLRHAVLLTLAEQLIATMTSLATHPPQPGAVPVAVELGFGRRGAPPVPVALSGMEPLFLKGSIDRVDQLPDGTRVASDYKLGSAASNQDKLSASSLGWKYLQLPIYLMALQAASAGDTRGYLWSIRHGRPSAVIGDGARSNVAEVMAGNGLRHDGMERRLIQLVSGLRGGRFTVTPEDPRGCLRCAYESVCRVGETHSAPDEFLERGEAP